MEKIIVRSTSYRDLREFLKLKNEEVLSSSSPIPNQLYSLRDICLWYENKVANNYPVICATLGQNIVGYATYGPLYGNDMYKFSIEYSLYVKTKNRGKGLGRLLLTTIMEQAKRENYNSIIANIDSKNKRSIEFHKKLGFSQLAEIRKVGFYQNEWMNVLIMEKRLSILATHKGC